MISTILQKYDDKLSLLSWRLVQKKPLFLARAGFASFQDRWSKTKKMRAVMFHTHYVCNFSCMHCYEKNFEKTSKPPLTTEEKKQILRKCLDHGIIAIDFIGGETRMSKDFEDLVQYCDPHKTYITLATNGYKYTEKQLQHYLDIGVDKLNISIDSWYPEEHDKFRKQKGSHAAALRTIELCKKIGMGVSVSIVVFKNYTKDPGFLKLVDWAVENKIRLNFKLAVALGEWDRNTGALVTEEDSKALEELHNRYPWLTRDIFFENGDPTCPAFRGYFSVTAYGDVLPCNAIHISFGNLKTDSVESVVGKAHKTKLISTDYAGCHASENVKFIDEYLDKSKNLTDYPIRAESFFEELKGEDTPTQTRIPVEVRESSAKTESAPR